MTRRIACVLVAVLASVVGLARDVRAGTFTVDTTVDDPALPTCDDAASNDCSLRGALIAANAAGEHCDIQLPPGTYTTSVLSFCPFVSAFGGTESFSATTLCITGNVSIIGSGPDTTIIDGLQSGRVIALDPWRRPPSAASRSRAAWPPMGLPSAAAVGSSTTGR
jgi:hypothetical protein